MNNELGALIDNRPEEAKKKDYKFEEIVASAAPVNWVEKDPKKVRRFKDQFQDGSGSCVAQTLRKMTGVYVFLKTKTYLDFSATHVYQRRSNKPDGGMIAVNAFDIGQKGITLEQFCPSEELTDAKMDAAVVTPFMASVGEAFKLGKYFTIATGDIDVIASIIQETGKAVMVWFYFTHSEWGADKKDDFTVPRVIDNLVNPTDPRASRHSVAAVDFFLYKGKKALMIEDSAPFAGVSRRIITEDFFKARNWFSAHFMNFAFEKPEDPVNPKPKYTFLKDLQFSTVVKYDPDVKALQDILKYEGFFPSNVESTGYFGSVTKVAVGKWQEKHNVAIPTDAGYGRVGPKSRGVLNSLYS